jgi:hypothetical protein
VRVAPVQASDATVRVSGSMVMPPIPHPVRGHLKNRGEGEGGRLG